MTFQEWERLHCGERAKSADLEFTIPIEGNKLWIPPCEASRISIVGEKSNPKADRHIEICRELNDTYRKKNEAYGDSFGKTYHELGIISAVTRMSDKMNRITSLATGAKNEVADESLKDTLKDLANYCIMTVIEMEKNNG